MITFMREFVSFLHRIQSSLPEPERVGVFFHCCCSFYWFPIVCEFVAVAFLLSSLLFSAGISISYPLQKRTGSSFPLSLFPSLTPFSLLTPLSLQISNTVRAAYLNLLLTLFEHHHHHIPPSHLTTSVGTEGGGEGGVGKVVEVLKGEFLTVKGSAQTLKSFMLKLIGAFAMYYPKEMEPKVPAHTHTLTTFV